MSHALVSLRRRMARQKRIPRTLVEEARLKQTLADVQPGGALEYEQHVFLVLRETQYRGLTTFREFTLEEVETGDLYNLEFALLDNWDIVFWRDTDVVISQVQFDGFSRGAVVDTARVRDFLAECSERDDGSIVHDGAKYFYSESSQGDWTGDKNPEQIRFTKYRSYSFASDDETSIVAFSVWQVADGENEVTVAAGQVVRHEDLTILALGDRPNGKKNATAAAKTGKVSKAAKSGARKKGRKAASKSK